MLICSRRQSATRHKLYTEPFWLGLFCLCLCRPALYDRPYLWPQGGLLPKDMPLCCPWLTKQPTRRSVTIRQKALSDLLPHWGGRCHAEGVWDSSKPSSDSSQPLATGIAHRRTEVCRFPKIPICAQVCHCHPLPIDRAALGGSCKVEFVAKPHIHGPKLYSEYSESKQEILHRTLCLTKKHHFTPSQEGGLWNQDATETSLFSWA